MSNHPNHAVERRTSQRPLPRLQRQLLLQGVQVIFSCWLACAVLSAIAAFVLVHWSEHALLVQRLASNGTVIVAMVVAPALASIGVASALQVRTTFRIAGPVYRYERVFETLASGRLPAHVHTRDGDHLGETTDLLQGACEELSQRTYKTVAALDELEEGLGAAGPEVRERCLALAETIRTLTLLPEGQSAERRPSDVSGDINDHQTSRRSAA